MGTIIVEEYDKAGLQDNTLIPIFNLNALSKRTEDSTTSSTPESLALGGNTRLLRIYTDEIHRVATSSAATSSGPYFTTEIGWNFLAVDRSTTIYYRTDA